MFRRLFSYFFGVVFCLAALLSLPHFASAATFTVNSPDDNNDGACTNPYVNAANDCTLREAINAANGAAGVDTITFAVDISFQSNPDYYSSNQYTFTIASAVTALTQTTIITGVASWDNSANRPGIRLYSTGTTFDGLTFNSGATNSKVQGLEIQGFRSGIAVAATGVTVGTDCDGTTDGTERNVVHAGSNTGITVAAATVLIAGNYIGLDDDGITSDAVTNSSITITGATADNAVIGYRDSAGSCTAAQQRNVIAGAKTAGTGAAITVIGTGTVNEAGDASLAPSGTLIAGNYIGVDSTGTAARGGAIGVYVTTNATTTIIGTDGDGTNDSSEKNVIYAAGTGVAITQTGNNRISGNTIGVTSAGTQLISTGLVQGVNARGTNNIIGWCDTTVDATLCSDAGVVANETNVIGGATNDGVRLGADCNNCKVYGNWIGVGSDGTTDLGNGISGVFIHRSTSGNRIGGSGSKANTIKYNATGITADGSFIGSISLGDPTYQHAITDLVISGNTINSNDGDGVYLYWTNNYDADPSVVDITIQNNAISQNGGYGVDVVGGSPDITGNTILSNTSNGIELAPGLLHYDGTNEAIASGDPQYASVNLLAKPSITSNTIYGNSTIGIAQLDTSASNANTLYADNTFSGTDSQTAVSQAWYGTVEVLTAAGTPIPAASWAGTTAQLQPTGGGSATATVANAAATGSDVVFGPSAISYTDVTTWSQFIDYTTSATGTKTVSIPYTISSSGTYTSNNSASYSFDGTNNDTAFSGALANGQTTGSLYRFQIAHVTASTVPSTPTTVSPSSGATGVSLTPTLQASAFVDASDTQAQATWQIYSSSSACSLGTTSQAVLNTTSATELTSFTVPTALTGNTVYYWRVAYINSFGNSSSFSTCDQFTTILTTPEKISDFPDETFAEDSTLDTGVRVNDYFTDAQSLTLTYSASVSDSNLIATIQADQTIALSAVADWFGQATLTVTACDPDGDCVSGTMVVTVTPVNDAPNTPTTGFSPADGDRSHSVQPTISWTAASDIDDASDALSYKVKIGTNVDPITHSVITLQSDTGVSSVTPTTALTDETTYYYAVRTVDAAGLQSDWSAIQSFHINVSNTPELHLTKTVTASSQQSMWRGLSQVAFGFMLGAITWIQPVAASSTPTAVMSRQIADQSWIILLGSAMVLLFAIIFVLVMARRPKHYITALLHDVPIAYNQIYQPDHVTQTRSYSSFKRQLLAARWLMYGAMIIIVPAFVMNVLHSQVSNWLVQVQTSAATLQPGESFTVALSYSNVGDGDATSAIVSDTVLSSTTFLSSTMPVTQHSQQISFDLGTIKSDESGTVSYQLSLAEPYAQDSLELDPAELIANEITTAALSDSVVVPVVFGSISGQVTDDSGVALSNVSISLQWGSQQTLTATTDTNGDYTFSGLASGDYVVVADTQQQATTLSRGGTATVNFTFVIASGGNGNTNETSNSNGNSNTNTAENTNVNTNTTTNTTVNTNTNSNTNTDTTTPVTTPPNPTPTDTTVTPTIPPVVLTPAQQDIVKSFVVSDLNGTTLPSSQPVIYLTDDPSQAPAGAVVLPTSTDTLTFRGKTLPNSTITIQICYTILTTTSDETGAWIMVVPRALLQQGENVVTASVTHDNVQVDQIVVAHVNVNNNLKVQPANYWINFMAIILLLQVDVAAWLLLRARHGNTTISGKLVLLHLVTAVVVVVLLSVPLPQSQQVAARGHLRQTDITARLVNNQPLTDQYATFQDAQALELIGSAAADQQYTVSICPNQPFRYVTTNHGGQWNLILPVSVLPTHVVTMAMSPVTSTATPEQQLVDINVQNDYTVLAQWRWILLGLILSGALFTIGNWFIAYRQLPQRQLPKVDA